MSTDQQTPVHPPDRDECLGGPSPCSHACHNAPGRFSCSCPAGFALAKDGRNCKGEWAPGGEAPLGPGPAMCREILGPGPRPGGTSLGGRKPRENFLF